MKRGWTVLLLMVVLLALPASAGGPSVEEDKGNIVLVEAGGKKRKLTASGQDSQPHLAPDGKAVVFVRRGSTQLESAAGEVEANELWWIDTAGSKPRRLVRSAGSDDPKKFLGALQAPQFSPDGKTVFFMSAAWVTSGSIHKVDVATGKVQFVAPGNSLEVIARGEYRGRLIAQQHKYFLGGGSYDWFWVLEPDGRAVGPIGDDMSSFRELYLSE